jgi:predicted membrane protein
MSAVVLVLLIFWAVPIYAIVDVARRPDEVWAATSNSKGLWILLLLLFGILAALVYFVVVRPRLIVAAQA